MSDYKEADLSLIREKKSEPQLFSFEFEGFFFLM